MSVFESLIVETETLTVEAVLIRIALAFALGIGTALLYRKTHQLPSCSRSFMNTLVMLSMVTCMVMIVIGNNVARAFSLVGALSIIRFRTAVKDTRDTAFVFFALASGMAAGTTKPLLTTSIFVGVSILVYVLHSLRLGYAPNGSLVLRFSVNPEDASQDVYLGMIRQHAKSVSLIGLESQKLGQLLELSYQLELRRNKSPQGLASDLSALPGVMKVSVLAGDEMMEP